MVRTLCKKSWSNRFGKRTIGCILLVINRTWPGGASIRQRLPHEAPGRESPSTQAACQITLRGSEGWGLRIFKQYALFLIVSKWFRIVFAKFRQFFEVFCDFSLCFDRFCQCFVKTSNVNPAQAGIQKESNTARRNVVWTPASAGVTIVLGFEMFCSFYGGECAKETKETKGTTLKRWSPWSPWKIRVRPGRRPGLFGVKSNGDCRPGQVLKTGNVSGGVSCRFFRMASFSDRQGFSTCQSMPIWGSEKSIP